MDNTNNARVSNSQVSSSVQAGPMKIVAGLDIGNGYVKGSTQGIGAEPYSIDIASCAAYVINPVDVPATEDAVEGVIADIFNRMDVGFESALVKDRCRMLFGQRGIASGKSISSFNIDSHLSKAEQDLSAVLVLGCVAGTALKDYWAVHKKLPGDVVEVHVAAGLALPITEYKKHRESFAQRFRSGMHIVTFYNFEQPVHVKIVFDNVQVLAEGASAQFAIVSRGESLMNAMLGDVRAHGIKLDGITAADILAADGTLGIDIGEGTVNFPVFTGGTFNTDASATLMKGYGTVLTKSIEPLCEKHLPFDNRKALAAFLQRPVNNLTRGKHDLAVSVVTGEAQNLVRDIVTQFTRIMEKTGPLIQVVYVYGGGASPIKELLYGALIEAAKPFCGGGDFPILYLDSRYSRYLNKDGLFTIAKQFAK